MLANALLPSYHRMYWLGLQLLPGVPWPRFSWADRTLPGEAKYGVAIEPALRHWTQAGYCRFARAAHSDPGRLPGALQGNASLNEPTTHTLLL